MFQLTCFVIIVIALTSWLLISSLLGHNADLTGTLISDKLLKHHPIVKPVPVPKQLYDTRYYPKTTTRTWEVLEDENRQSYSTIFVTSKISGNTVENFATHHETD